MRATAAALALMCSASLPGPASAEPSAQAEGRLAAAPPQSVEPPQTDSPPDGYTPDEPVEPALTISGYVDVGYAKAQGNGTSFVPGDTRVPADYGVDPFAPAVNSRGEVASTDSGGRLVNGFLPRSVGIGGHGSFLINTVDLDIRYSPREVPVMAFVRAQFLPRFFPSGDQTRVLVEQAFARVTPLTWQEFAISVGKFDSVFGIEYLENQANIRTGITPSIIARYTTGQSVGLKAFYRYQIPAIWSALSLNVAATNSGSRVDSLRAVDISLNGVPNFSGRLGYELNLARVQLKLGISGLRGPRNDQIDPNVEETMLGVDGRLFFHGFSLAGELIRSTDDPGTQPGKMTGTGSYPLASGFRVEGGYAELAYRFQLFDLGLQAVTPYGRFGRRNGTFEGFSAVRTSQVTVGLRIDAWSILAIKAEYLINGELPGTPVSDNNVFTSSLVCSW